MVLLGESTVKDLSGQTLRAHQRHKSARQRPQIAPRAHSEHDITWYLKIYMEDASAEGGERI